MKTVMVLLVMIMISTRGSAESGPHGALVAPSEIILEKTDEGPGDIRIEKGKKVLVESYDSSARAYNLTILEDNAAGPNFVTLEDFASSIIGFSPERIQKNPEELVGKKIILQKEVVLASGALLNERAARENGQPKGLIGNGKSLFVSLDDYEALKIEKGTEVEVESYDAKSKTFSLVMTKYPDQGPNYTTLGLLSEAIQELEGQLAELAKRPERLQGKKFQLSKELKLISEDEVESREQQFSKTKQGFPEKKPAGE